MEIGGIIIAAAGALGGVGAAIFAWVQAKIAVDSREDALAAQSAAESARDEALQAAKQGAAAADRQADALEVANRLLADAQALNERLAPPAWSQARFPGSSTFAFDNTSGRHIILTSVEIEPEHSYLRIHMADLPHRVENGDAFGVRWFGAYSLPAPERVTLGWHFEDSPGDEQRTERNL